MERQVRELLLEGFALGDVADHGDGQVPIIELQLADDQVDGHEAALLATSEHFAVEPR